MKIPNKIIFKFSLNNQQKKIFLRQQFNFKEISEKTGKSLF